MPKPDNISTPKFNNPPVIETVMGVQFPELAGFRAAHFGRYWDIIKQRYPDIEDKPRLSKVIETFPHRFILPEPSIRFNQGGAPDRVWYISESKTELIQVQPDRFLFNWRGAGADSSYPSYAQNSNVFFQEFSDFCRFCEKGKLGDPVPELCEVTYINHIVPTKGETAADLFEKVFAGLSWQGSDDWLPTPQDATLNRTYLIGEDLGRLYVEAGIAFQKEADKISELVILRLTARVLHKSKEKDSLKISFKLAHDWVVKGFASITDPSIQKERWERTV